MPGHCRPSATSRIWGQGIKYPPGDGNRQQSPLPQPCGTHHKKAQGIIFSKNPPETMMKKTHCTLKIYIKRLEKKQILHFTCLFIRVPKTGAKRLPPTCSIFFCLFPACCPCVGLTLKIWQLYGTYIYIVRFCLDWGQ